MRTCHSDIDRTGANVVIKVDGRDVEVPSYLRGLITNPRSEERIYPLRGSRLVVGVMSDRCNLVGFIDLNCDYTFDRSVFDRDLISDFLPYYFERVKPWRSTIEARDISPILEERGLTWNG